MLLKKHDTMLVVIEINTASYLCFSFICLQKYAHHSVSLVLYMRCWMAHSHKGKQYLWWLESVENHN